MEELIEILKEAAPDVDFENTRDIISGRRISSLAMMMIVAGIENVFDVDLDPDDIVADNFDSVDSIWSLIQNYKNK